jgi:hypothetical protein
MTTKKWLGLCGLALLVPAWGMLWATDATITRTTGRVLVLVNERTLEGEIQREGDEYCVRRTSGEVWVPGSKVLCMCSSWDEAYAYLRSQANLRDADERMRIARWCQLHGLRKQALAEVTAAVDLRPNDQEAQRWERLLKRALVSSRQATNGTGPPPTPPLPPSLPPVDISQESMTAFIGQVQPILMNACASCHATNRGGDFRLMRSYHGGMLNQRATQFNLSAVMAEIDVQRPRISPLLVKAISSHGQASQAPLRGRQTAAFQHLEEWVETTLAQNPQLVEEPARVSGNRPSSVANAKSTNETPQAAPAVNSADSLPIGMAGDAQDRVANPVVALSSPANGATISGQGPGPRVEGNTLAGKPLAPAAFPMANPNPLKPVAPPADEFSGEIFNQQWHGDKSR